MSHSSARPGRPVDRIWQETLLEFGRPVAVLARPEPGWHRSVGRQTVDGLLQRLDLEYDEERAERVVVTTQRRLPEHFRVFPTLELDGLLRQFLVNSSSYDGQTSLPWALTPGPGQLLLDGTPVEAQRLAHGDHVATLAAIGEEIIAVTSFAALHDRAVQLTFETAAG